MVVEPIMQLNKDIHFFNVTWRQPAIINVFVSSRVERRECTVEETIAITQSSHTQQPQTLLGIVKVMTYPRKEGVGRSP